jgi:carbonic anhydrase/acetyltransferase-like protein (isoleucine patch superfamily)
MLITRNGQPPIVHPSAVIASSAQVIGNVSIGESCCVDYNAVIESSSTHSRSIWVKLNEQGKTDMENRL